jgi:hypothetical protein
MKNCDGMIFVVKALKTEMATRFHEVINRVKQCVEWKPLLLAGTHLLEHDEETWTLLDQKKLENYFYSSNSFLRPMTFCDPAHFLASKALATLLSEQGEKPSYKLFWESRAFKVNFV